jgi:hypothetical protein
MGKKEREVGIDSKGEIYTSAHTCQGERGGEE